MDGLSIRNAPRDGCTAFESPLKVEVVLETCLSCAKIFIGEMERCNVPHKMRMDRFPPRFRSME